ncbi:1,3-beta-glucanosyltransferase gel2 [Cytospora mali]|uniref:1,3-beta-glucanosyltransferase n=1 Tax=Cytospora mali TaxID=578113 RepID=A0A194VE91_CYTMA|nr:1,3-beta-glucanosyltransferase gel2 [Valsa mali var. pyri (nom. inval.)]
MFVQRTIVGLVGAASLAAAVPAIDVKGSFFVNQETGDRYQIVGVAYQPGGSAGYNPGSGVDPLSNKDECLRDAALMQILGVNAIRVYNVDPNVNHDECASIFNAAGMYMFLDVNSPLSGESISSAAPWESYYAAYLNRTFAVVEAFKNYPNTAAFFAGNEVIYTEQNGATVPPYMRAVTRDLKNYIAKHSDREIPVGYSAADVRSILFDSWNYLQCDNGEDDNSAVDLFALNSYSWCGKSTFQESGYDQLVAGFTGSSVPIFFSEFGCNTPAPRVFTEVPEIYSDEMQNVFSGGIVYEYAQEANNYGLVNITDDGSATLMEDFYTLKEQYSNLNFTLIQGIAPQTDSTPAPKCKESLITTKNFVTNFTVPSLPPGAADLIKNGVKPAPVGKIVTIDDYSVTVTVKGKDGNTLSNLAVVPLKANEINQPGSNTQNTTSDSTSSTSTTSDSTSSGSGKSSSATGTSAGVRSVQGGAMPWMMASAVVASLFFGFLA